MNARQLNARLFHPRNFVNSALHSDLLFNIMTKLDVQHLMLLWFAAKNSPLSTNQSANTNQRTNKSYWKNKKNISSVLSNQTFWKANAEHHLPPQQLTDEFTHHQKLILNRYQAYHLIKNELDHSIYYTKNFFRGHYFTDKYEGLPDVSIKDIQELLLHDEAESLFYKIMEKPELLLLVKKDNYDITAIQQCMDITQLNDEHLRFIGLLPLMVKLRAAKCFDLFFRTYQILCTSFSQKRSISENYFPSLSLLEQLIFSLGEIDFTKHVLGLVLKLAPPFLDPTPSIKYVLEAGYDDVLSKSLNAINKEQLNYLLQHCEKDSIPKSLILSFCDSPDFEFESKYKATLEEILKKAASIESHYGNFDANINELSLLQEKMNSHFTQWIRELHERKMLQNTNQCKINIDTTPRKNTFRF